VIVSRNDRDDKNTPRRSRQKADAGPRPLSPAQQAYREEVLGIPATPPEPQPARPAAETSRPRSRGGRQVRDIRDASHTRVRRIKPPVNRRKINWWRVALGVSSVCLVGVCIGAALFSPRLAIRTVTVEGNASVPIPKLMARLKHVYGQNIVRLSSAWVKEAVLAEPTIETVTLRRELPDKVRVTVVERQPWAAVQMPTGDCYTIDEKLVPFRKSERPEKGLPRLVLSPGETPIKPVKLGEAMTAPGLADVSRCLTWARSEPGFTLESVSIDPTGKLCLNRMGGVQIRLGSQTDLSRKLNALGLLMERRPDLKTGTEVAYVNLYAYDAPAVMPRAAALSPGTSAPPTDLSQTSDDASGGDPDRVTPRDAPARRGSSEPL
jgi:cell division septal protein FtsQ